MSNTEKENQNPSPATDAEAKGGGKKRKLKKIGKNDVEQARAKLEHFKAAKQPLNAVIRWNEKWYRQRHMEYIRTGQKLQTDNMEGDTVPVHRKGETVEPVSSYLFSAISNFHADYSDNYPRANILPREQSDEEEAYKITRILPSLLDRIGFEEVYSRAGWTKAIQGWSVYTVTWDRDANDGVGEVAIGRAKLLNLYWDMEVDELSKSSDVFYLHERNREELVREHPHLKETLKGSDPDHERHETVTVGDGMSKVTVVDWYYRKRTASGKKVLHLCQFVNSEILYASENEPSLTDRGIYDHGKYPFVVDVLYPMEDALYGFGKVAVGSSKQGYIDILSQSIMKNALWSSVPRYFVKKAYGFNLEDFVDVNKMLVEVEGSGNLDEYVKRIEVSGIDGSALSLQDRMVDELREVTNMQSLSQGAPAGGVTAASGIAALQEAQGKTARDSNRASFRAFRQIVTLVIELMRQFYTEKHFFRVLNEDTGEMVYLSMDNEHLAKKKGVLFDLEITTERQSTWSRMSNNELMLSFYNGGFFDPNRADQAKACLELMDFEGKEELIRMITENDNRQQLIQSVLDYMIQLGTAYDQMLAQMGQQSNEAQNVAVMAEQVMGEGFAGAAGAGARMPTASGESAVTQKARKEAAAVASPG